MTRARLRPATGVAARAQTHEYAKRVDLLASQLRGEIEVPARAAGRAGVVQLMGLPGSGKTHCARWLVRRLGAAQVASDEIRSRLFIAATYAEEENRAVFGAIEALVDGLLADGHVVIADATNLGARNRAGIEAVAARRAVPLVHVHVVAPDTEIRARLAARTVARAAHDRSDADERVYDRMRARPFEPPEGGHLTVTNGPSLEADLEAVAVALGQLERG